MCVGMSRLRRERCGLIGCRRSRRVGEQAGRARGVPDRPQPGVLRAHPQLPEARSADRQRGREPERWGGGGARLCWSGVSAAGLTCVSSRCAGGGPVLWAGAAGRAAGGVDKGKWASVWGFRGQGSDVSRLTCQTPSQNARPAEDHSPISRKELVRFLLATPTKSELRCQVG